MSILVRSPGDLGELVGKPGETLAETLRRTLLDMIVFGYFERGTRLYPEKLAEHFNVSLTPVREALMRLAAEGFIEVIQRRGYHIRDPDAKQVLDLWQVRLAIELMAGELMIERLEAGTLPETAVAEIEVIQQRLAVEPHAISHKDRHELNGSFHHKIVEFSGNDLLLSTYRGIQMQVLNAWIQRGIESWRLRHASEAVEHNAIIKALRDRSPDDYAKAVRAHLARSLKDAQADLKARNLIEELTQSRS
ncbi:MAG TPA: GntR family transcriptional regulator [Bosea sp. (in: a-proteobacteria)]|jgi:DNA-binding GntR family transcriptional regulator|uniref:GntR family transcriptional regulator n=1 Tax=Bosea sp. (in: a-proteobacteria) TaxID=1871050 RepID=UPI002E1258CE|nr:GntR family transcriptional regulator [Bosea sp. (in: a-proteobacteria)]